MLFTDELFIWRHRPSEKKQLENTRFKNQSWVQHVLFSVLSVWMWVHVDGAWLRLCSTDSSPGGATSFSNRHDLIYESFTRGNNEERKIPSIKSSLFTVYCCLLLLVFNAPVISCLSPPCVRIELTHRLTSQRFDWVCLAFSDVKAGTAAPAATEKLSRNVTTLNRLSVRGLGQERGAIRAEPGSQPAYQSTQRVGWRDGGLTDLWTASRETHLLLFLLSNILSCMFKQL